MKTYIRTFILLMAFGLSATAMSQGKSLTVFTGKGENFTVFVNGVQKNTVEADHVTVEGLFGPNFKVRIVFKDPAIHEINKTVFNSPGGGEIYYVLRPGKKGEYVMEKTTSDYVRPNEAAKESKQEQKQPAASSESATKKAGAGCDNPMNEGDFQSSTIAISSAPFDPIKLSNAKKLVETHCLYARQIAEVMHILNYDSSRLTIAKDAYKHCYDPENYGDVRDVLNNRSKQDLDNYINSLK